MTGQMRNTGADNLMGAIAFPMGVVSVASLALGTLLWAGAFGDRFSPRGAWQLSSLGFMVFCLGMAGMVWILGAHLCLRFFSEDALRGVRTKFEKFPTIPLCYVILVGCIFGMYWPALEFSFFGDDFYLLGLISEGVTRVLLPIKEIYHYFPVTLLLIGIPRWLGIGDAATYHFINILFHSANAGLVYLIAKELLESRFAAFAAATLFAFFFLTYDPVIWPLVGNHYVVSTFFALFSFLSFLRYRRAGGRQYLYFFVLFYCLSVYTHEICIPLIGACLFYDLTCGSPNAPLAERKARLRVFSIYLVPFAALVLLWCIKHFFTVRILITQNTPTKLLQNVAAAFCFLLPFNNMNAYWIFSGWGNYPVFLVAAVILFAAAVVCAYAKAGRQQRVMLVWSICFILPPVLFGEPSPRHLYPAAAGWAVFWTAAIMGIAGALSRLTLSVSDSPSPERERLLLTLTASLACLCVVLQGHKHAAHLMSAWRHGSDMVKGAIESTAELIDLHPEKGVLIVVNQPTHSPGNTFYAAPLLIGPMHRAIRSLTDSDAPEIKSVRLHSEHLFDEAFPRISVPDLDSAASEPDTLVIIYDPQALRMIPYQKSLP